MSGVVAIATGVLQGAIATLGPALGAAGINTAALSASLAATSGAVAAAGPAAPFVIVAVYLARTWAKIKRSSAGVKACRDRAGLYLLAKAAEAKASVYVARVPEVPTPEWPECWHRGKKTKNKSPGRTSERVPGTVVREDVLPSGYEGGPSLARLLIGRDLMAGELLIVPMLGPFAISRGGMRSLDVRGWAPSASAACIQTTASIIAAGGLKDSGDRKIAAKVALWAANIASGGEYLQNGMVYKPSKQLRDEARQLAFICIALLG